MTGGCARHAAAERKFVVDRTNAPGWKRSTEQVRPQGGRADKPLRNTNRHYAYFGEVTRNDLIGDWATFRNETIGGTGVDHATPANTSWHKFACNGKIVFVVRIPVVRGISWNQLYNAQVVGSHGTTGVGGTNTGAARGSGSGVHTERTALQQNKTITRNGVNYDVRLLTGGTAAIATNNGQASGPFNFSSGGEWDQLLVSLSEHTAWNKRQWALFTNGVLGLRQNATNAWRNEGTASWVQNNAGSTAGHNTFSGWGSPSRGNARMLRGFGGRRTGAAGRDAAIVHPDLSASSTTIYTGPDGPPGSGGLRQDQRYYAWRPVLEVRNVTLQVSGGGRGGGWKGIPRDIPNNVGWVGA